MSLTLEGVKCKRCLKGKNRLCWQHRTDPIYPDSDYVPRPVGGIKSPWDDIMFKKGEKTVPNIFSGLPCDILLQIGNKLDPKDYVRMAMVSKAIYNCLKTGNYTAKDEKKAENFLSNAAILDSVQKNYKWGPYKTTEYNFN